MLLTDSALRGPSRLSEPGALVACDDFAFLALAGGSETGWDREHPEVTRQVLEAVVPCHPNGVEAVFSAAQQVVERFPEDDLGSACSTLLAVWCWPGQITVAWLGDFDGWHRSRRGWVRFATAHTIRNQALAAGFELPESTTNLGHVISKVVRKDFATPHVVKLTVEPGDRLVFHTRGGDESPPDGTAAQVAEALSSARALAGVLDFAA